MDNQKAIKILGQYDVSDLHFYTTDGEEIPFAEWSDALELAISALEKQIPMEPLDPELGISPRHPLIIPCGNCEMELADHMWEYCPWCGQKICWEEDE